MKVRLRLTLSYGLGAALVFLFACDSSGESPAREDPEAPAASSSSSLASSPASLLVRSHEPNPNQAGAEEAPAEYTNLQVLPDDTTKSELLGTMKLITKSLGVRCNFCHRTDTRDYASDEIEKKIVARQMMRMVLVINHDQFTWHDAPKATCFMCHHGHRKPRLEPTE